MLFPGQSLLSIMKSILGHYERASSLANEPISCLRKVTHIMNMPMPCEYIGNFRSAIKIMLDEELGMYDAELEGVPVAYNKNTIKFTDKFAEMTGVLPIIHCKIQCDFIVFTPLINCVLGGIVNKVTSKFIGCLIHGCFYASIHHSTPTDKRLIGVKIGDAVKLRVVKLEEDGGGVLSIIGEIRALHPNRDNHVTSQQDSAVADAISNVDSGMEDVFVSSNGDPEIEDFDNTLSTLPNFTDDTIQADNTLPVQSVEECLSQQDVNSNDIPDTKTKKKKKKEKKEKKEKKKHKKKLKEDSDHISAMQDGGTEQLRLPETVSVPVADVGNMSPHLNSWLASREENHPSLVTPKPSDYEMNGSYTGNAMIMSSQSDQVSSDDRGLKKSSPKKGVKRKMSNQDGSNPKKRAISTPFSSNESRQEEKGIATHLSVNITTTNTPSAGPTIRHQECNDKDGYSSISSVDDTINWVIRHYADQMVDDQDQVEAPCENVKLVTTSERETTKHTAKNSKSVKSPEKEVPISTTNNSEPTNSLENGTTKNSAIPTKLMNSPKKCADKNTKSLNSQKKVNPKPTSTKMAKSSNSSESDTSKLASKEAKRVTSQKETQQHFEQITVNSEVSAAPMSPKIDPLAVLRHQNPDLYEQLIKSGWTPPPKAATSLTNSTVMQENTNSILDNLGPVEHPQSVTSITISQDENHSKKKKKKSKSSSKNNDENAVMKKSKKKHKHKHASENVNCE